MSDLGDLPKHTFLSRVFGMNAGTEGSATGPLLQDDDDDLEEYTPLERVKTRTSVHSTDTTDSEDSGMLLARQEEGRAPSQDADSSGTLSGSNSETHPRAYNPQKEAIRTQLQNEFEEDNMVDLDLVPDSLLLEGQGTSGGGNGGNGRYNRSSRLPRSSRATPTPHTFAIPRTNLTTLGQLGQMGQSFMQESIAPGLNQLGHKIAQGVSHVTHRREQQSPIEVEMEALGDGGGRGRLSGHVPMLSATERALWIWANVTNLDLFLGETYKYYRGNGYQCILLSRACDMLVVVFVVWMSSFMGNCVDYDSLLSGSATKFSQVKVPQCYSKISWMQKLLYWVLVAVLGIRIRKYYREFRDLRGVRLFYNYLLGISDAELQTISWPTIVKRIMILRDQNTNAVVSGTNTNDLLDGELDDLRSKKRLNAHDIANRLMRRDNYMIALFNKQILARSLRLPLFNNAYFLTKTLEWNLKLCIFDYLFDPDGQLKKSVLSEHSRLSMSMNLKHRFQVAGLLSIVLTPVLVVYFLLYFFLRFFYEFRTNPSSMSTREFSPYAYWKLREFNELPHIFEKRLKLAVEGANDYLNQFPKERTDIVLKFVAFVTGSIVAVLALLTVFGHENFLNFELTEDRTVLFYMSTLGAVYTICKGSISDRNTVFDPEASLRYVAQFTHYLPKAWEGRYHTDDVRAEFCKLFNLKVVLVLKELASLILLPYLLYFRLPDCSDRIIDFFREFTIHVDGLGYVCSFAMFNFEGTKDKPDNMFVGNSGKWDRDSMKSGYYAADDDKMAKSYMYFLENYGDHPQPQSRAKSSGNHMLKSAVRGAGRLHARKAADSVRSEPFERMEETTAGLSPDTRSYLNNLSNSLLLGEPLAKSKVEPEDDNGGVLGLLKVYKQPK